LIVSTISINELKKRPIGQWLRSGGDGDIVVTSEGRPVAVLLPIHSEGLQSTLSMLRSIRAVQAMSALQQTAARNGACKLSQKEIDAEIKVTRRIRRRK
jgi:prevent-host-death family protein